MFTRRPRAESYPRPGFEDDSADDYDDGLLTGFGDLSMNDPMLGNPSRHRGRRRHGGGRRRGGSLGMDAVGGMGFPGAMNDPFGSPVGLTPAAAQRYAELARDSDDLGQRHEQCFEAQLDTYGTPDEARLAMEGYQLYGGLVRVDEEIQRLLQDPASYTAPDGRQGEGRQMGGPGECGMGAFSGGPGMGRRRGGSGMDPSAHGPGFPGYGVHSGSPDLGQEDGLFSGRRGRRRRERMF